MHLLCTVHHPQIVSMSQKPLTIYFLIWHSDTLEHALVVIQQIVSFNYSCYYIYNVYNQVLQRTEAL